MSGGPLPAEHELIPYAPGFPPGGRWLVLAPHPDDEVFGVGATLSLGVRRGVQVHVVVVTDGGAQGDGAVRESESRAAARALGVPEPEFWRFPDRSLVPAGAALRAKIAGALEHHAPDVLFVTSPVEFHPDHRALALAARRVVRARSLGGLRGRPPEWIAAYEVGAPLRPNVLVAADEAWERKRAAVSCFAGQIAVRRYDEVVEAFGTLRALTLDGVRKAEGFHIEGSRRVARGSASRWAASIGVSGGQAPAGSDRGRETASPAGDGRSGGVRSP
ncbi:MAG TPA: PIG-L deacetylase family protein [Thermoanaerobaculaceae bacterium]|nr:PIG-L deacetylase family protein [Thermoanaerobaculaceae bacterium]